MRTKTYVWQDNVVAAADDDDTQYPMNEHDVYNDDIAPYSPGQYSKNIGPAYTITHQQARPI